MRFLLTNDDGIHAPGLQILADIAGQFGEVVVVAPDTERSGVSHAITLFRPLRLRQAKPGWQVCDGTPTDCIYLALNQLHLDPDIILSGINPGPNLGHDVLYSGTVAGALEGAHWGVPSIALSHCASGEDHLAQLAEPIAALLPRLIDAAREHRGVLNVNLPDITRGPWRGVLATRMGHRYYSNEVVQRDDPRGRSYFWIGGAHVHMPDIDGSDCNAVRDGYVSVTPLGDDLTHHRAVADLATRLT
jgi:5'-nucleotidase